MYAELPASGMSRRAKPIHVEITLSGHQVIVRSGGSLDDAAATALALWRATESKDAEPGDGQFHVGFTVSEQATSPLMPPEADLPYHMTSTGVDDER